MPMPKKPKYKQKSKVIRFLVTEEDFERYQVHKNRLSVHSPTLSSSKIFRKVAEQIDDKAFLYFLYLDSQDELKNKLRFEYDFLNLGNKQKSY